MPKNKFCSIKVFLQEWGLLTHVPLTSFLHVALVMEEVDMDLALTSALSSVGKNEDTGAPSLLTSYWPGLGHMIQRERMLKPEVSIWVAMFQVRLDGIH